MKRITIFIAFAAMSAMISAQRSDNRQLFSGLTLGGYGEAVYSRNFFSDSPFRYMKPESHADDPSHGRFDLPHIVFFVGYDFGKGWKFSSEIEFEHGGTESAVEVEAEEGGEYESEIERGGEVVLEQFWIEKTFGRGFNVRAGHLIVPIGYTNGNHLPTEFFTVYRPEGERTVFPCTWHETGISVWGVLGKWRYEALLLPGLDSELFGNNRWIGNASASPYEFRVANKYAGVLRFDNYSIKGLRMGIAGYYGYSFRNSLMPSYAATYDKVKGAVAVGSFDFAYNSRHIVARGSFDYGHLGDAQAISSYNRNLPKQSPSSGTNIASEAIATGAEVGLDVLSFKPSQRHNARAERLFIFSRYDYYDSMYRTPTNILDEEWCGRQIVTVGLNYFPVNEIAIKAEYVHAMLKSPFNNEPAVNIAITYAGFFR